MKIRSVAALALCLILSGLIERVSAASHLWVVHEVFSNADGTVQFIEMHVPGSAPGETFLDGKWVRSTTTGNQLDFTENLPPGSTAFAFLLLGTQAFADLPGAPVPDYILPSSFFDLDSDLIKYWNYLTGDMAFESGELPVDGITSLNRDGTTGLNSPTNFAGETGSVDASATSAYEDPASPETDLDFFLRVIVDPTSPKSIILEFQLPSPANATLQIFDTMGRLRREVFKERARGLVRTSWDGTDVSGESVASGVYLARLESEGRVAVRKLPFIR